MLLNISNHPLATWSSVQYDKAILEYGAVIDYVLPIYAPTSCLTDSDIQKVYLSKTPFPNIPPEFNPEKIAALSCQTCMDILQYKQLKAVHIMGEFNFCFDLITRLHTHNLLCIASTRMRNVHTDIFEFYDFRNYNTP